MASDLERALGALIPAPERPPLPAAAKPQPIPATVGVGVRAALPGKGGGAAGGNLEETARTLHPAHVITSSDGLITFEVQPIATLTLRDAGGNAVVWTFANPFA